MHGQEHARAAGGEAEERHLRDAPDGAVVDVVAAEVIEVLDDLVEERADATTDDPDDDDSD